MKTHLILPDSHAHPKESNRRFQWFGKLAFDLKPDVVINVGDLWDMESLCSYDKGTKGSIGRNYQADCDAGNEAIEMMEHRFRKNRKKHPRWIDIEGNHENRIRKAINQDPFMIHDIGLNDLNTREFVEYNGASPGIIEVDGILYSHFFVSGIMGRPIGGEHAAHSMLKKLHTSATAGHSHLVDYNTQVMATGKRIHGLQCGVYQEHSPSFAGNATDLWWRGAILKTQVADGDYNIRLISMDEIKKEYG